MGAAIRAIIITIGLNILKSSTKLLWSILWQVVASAIEEAERKWTEIGTGAVKKEWVQSITMEYIKKNMKLNPISGCVVNMFISIVIDNIIEKLNAQFTDHKWIEYVSSLRQQIEVYLPSFLKGEV